VFCPSSAQALTMNNVKDLIAWDCIGLTVIGMCYTYPPPKWYILYAWWEPLLLIETVKNPGDSLIEGMGDTIKKYTESSMKGALGSGAVQPTSGNINDHAAETNMFFSEAHVYKFPYSHPLLNWLNDKCGETQNGDFMKYFSELDCVEWRHGLTEMWNLKYLTANILAVGCSSHNWNPLHEYCLGVWGPLYLRRGWFVHSSEVVASAAQAARAVHILNPGDQTKHKVIDRLKWMPIFALDKLQLLYADQPAGIELDTENRGKCIKIGQNPAEWESMKTSSTGKYLWVYWRFRVCCYELSS